MSGVKTYRRHNCERTHRTYRALARCVWPRAAWVAGDGSYAVVAWCRPVTVSLWPDYESATESLALIDAHRCGHACGLHHEIIELRPVTR